MNLHECNHYPEQDVEHFLHSLAWYLLLLITPPSKLTTMLASGFELAVNGIAWCVLLTWFHLLSSVCSFICIVACNHGLFFSLQYTILLYGHTTA